ncbi:MFS transporter [Streptomyces tateyamensis]|uniref:MFS transporter n=1 Tax=Streptomyces tateyamensis TaxID=565073 RepID=A0A2V4N7X0_9ACTN|nr:MFS transporter [Streptomyces tateyamensis]PYC73044.1 MFS transporter [Streptomyces tateyamensis]
MYLADSRTAPARDTRPGRGAAVPATVLALGTVSLITDISSEMVTAVLPLYLVAGLGVSPLGFGLLDGIYNGVGALVRLSAGVVADRGGGRHKAVALVGYGLSALCKPLLLVAGSLVSLGAVLAVDRTGKGLRTAPRDALISLSSAPERRGRAFGVHRAMDTAGALIGPLLAFTLLRATQGQLLVAGGDRSGYRAVFAVSGCVAALGVVVLLLFVPGRLRGPEAVEHHAVTRRLWRLAGLRRLTGAAVLLGLTTVSDSFVYLLVQRRLALPTADFPLLPLGTAAGFLLLAVPFGVLADKVGRRVLFLAGHGALLAAYGLLLRAGGGHWVPFAVLALHGTFYAATDGVLAAAAAEVIPEEHRGAGLALIGTGQTAARFCCSLAFGAAWTAFGPHTALALAAGALALAAGCAGLLIRTETPG